MKKHLLTVVPALLAAAVAFTGAAAYAQVSSSTNTSGAANTGGTYDPATGLYTTGSSGGVSGTVGAPNTGAGGDAPMNVAILVSSGMIAAGSSLYLHSRKHAPETQTK